MQVGIVRRSLLSCRLNAMQVSQAGSSPLKEERIISGRMQIRKRTNGNRWYNEIHASSYYRTGLFAR